MKIKRIYDEDLSQASYIVISEGEAVVIDPARDPSPYYEFLEKHKASLKGIIETHPHADFVSAHLEMTQKTGAPVYVSKKVGADYPHQAFDEGDEIPLKAVRFKALNTPGHSPDSISVVLEDNQGTPQAVFTGDTLLIGDAGRPDLRESSGKEQSKKEELARQLYYSLRNKLRPLAPNVKVYPAHGAGSLCGRGMSEELSSTIGEQLQENPALRPMSENKFVEWLLADPLFIPQYFSYNIDLNKAGAPVFEDSIAAVPRLVNVDQLHPEAVVLDVRSEEVFKARHYPGAINIMAEGKLETWLGSLIGPNERFYLVATSEDELERSVRRTAKIGYEGNIVGAFVFEPQLPTVRSDAFDLEAFRRNPGQYTIVDVRNKKEVEKEPIFESSVNIPLHELREKVNTIPSGKPVVVHCASGYRSAAAYSIVSAARGAEQQVYDLSDAVEQFRENE